MRVYELLSLLSEAKAGDKIKVSICLSTRELMDGDQIDKDLYCLTLDVENFDAETGEITTCI